MKNCRGADNVKPNSVQQDRCSPNGVRRRHILKIGPGTLLGRLRMDDRTGGDRRQAVIIMKQTENDYTVFIPKRP